MAAQNTTFEFNLNADQQAVFGIVLNKEGIVEEIKAGSFSSSDADAMADHLVLLAARIRNAAYAAEAPALKLDPLRLDRGDDGGMADWLSAQLHAGRVPIIHGTAEPAEVAAAQAALGAERAGALVEDSLARAATLARGLGVTRFVVAGGETSGACVQALGITQMRIGAQIDPGVPWCHAVAPDAKDGLHITLKSGNFGGTDFFTKAFAQLQA